MTPSYAYAHFYRAFLETFPDYTAFYRYCLVSAPFMGEPEARAIHQAFYVATAAGTQGREHLRSLLDQVIVGDTALGVYSRYPAETNLLTVVPALYDYFKNQESAGGEVNQVLQERPSAVADAEKGPASPRQNASPYPGLGDARKGPRLICADGKVLES